MVRVTSQGQLPRTPVLSENYAGKQAPRPAATISRCSITAARDALRVEAGILVYGPDVDDTLILPEARLDALVSYTKGCYIGQETVARVKYRGHINRGVSGLVVSGDEVPSHGDLILADDKEVGRITSAVRSIALGKPIALGYIRREHFEPGSPVSVKIGDRRVPAHVAALPFVPPA